jgi:hypothetical protein
VTRSVLVTRAVPGPDCIVTEALTQPFHVVGTAKLDLEPQLDLTEETVSCD